MQQAPTNFFHRFAQKKKSISKTKTKKSSVQTSKCTIALSKDLRIQQIQKAAKQKAAQLQARPLEDGQRLIAHDNASQFEIIRVDCGVGVRRVLESKQIFKNQTWVEVTRNTNGARVHA